MPAAGYAESVWCLARSIVDGRTESNVDQQMGTMDMDALSMTALADAQLNAARGARVGRAAHTVYGGQDCALRQTLLALAEGQRLDEHENPGEATLFVLDGRVQLGTSTGPVEGGTGDFIVIPEERHHLVALEDSVVLLTVVAKG